MSYDPNPMVSSQVVSFDNTAIAFSSRSDAELQKMYWLFASMNQNWLVGIGTGMLKTAFQWKLPFVRNLVKHTLFGHFCGGESIAECETVIHSLHQFRIGTILDYSVEGAKTEEGFEATTQEILATIAKARHNPAIPFSVFKVTGIADAGLLARVQKGERLTEVEKNAFVQVEGRMERICGAAHKAGVRLFVDGEETWIQDTIDKLTYAMMEQFNKQQAIVYNTYQFYRHDMLAKLKQAYAMAEDKGYVLGIRLVRGAYMEKERREATEENRQDPIQPDKLATDRDFDEGLHFCVQHYPRIALCAGTHNEASTRLLMQLMQENGIAPSEPLVYFAQLYGMSDNLSYNLAHFGYNVAKYVPYGPVEAVMPYLFRRAAENTAISGQSSREFQLIRQEMQRRRKKG
jgi:proline dehydrogenase